MTERESRRADVRLAQDVSDGVQTTSGLQEAEIHTQTHIIDDVRLAELLGEYDAAIAELDVDGLAKLEANYDQALRETSEGGKVVSLTEYHERQGLVEEVRESSEDSLARLKKRTRELREQRNRAYKEIVEGLPRERWIRNCSEAILGSLERQKANPSFGLALRVCQVLGESMERVFPYGNVDVGPSMRGYHGQSGDLGAGSSYVSPTSEAQESGDAMSDEADWDLPRPIRARVLSDKEMRKMEEARP